MAAPTREGRTEILGVHAHRSGLLFGEGVDLQEVAKSSTGLTGADLAALLNDAALLAARKEAKAVEAGDLSEALERAYVGIERPSLRVSDLEKRVVSFHEVGHAIAGAAVGAALNEEMPGSWTQRVRKISIVPRGGGALGYTLNSPEEDMHLMSEDYFRAQMVVLFGGRVAEQLIFKRVTNGASDDMQRATAIAERMVGTYGMSRLGPRVLAGGGGSYLGQGQSGWHAMRFGDTLANTADKEVSELLTMAEERTRAVLSANRCLLDEMAEKLLSEEVLDGEALAEYLKRTHVPADLKGWLSRSR